MSTKWLLFAILLILFCDCCTCYCWVFNDCCMRYYSVFCDCGMRYCLVTCFVTCPECLSRVVKASVGKIMPVQTVGVLFCSPIKTLSIILWTDIDINLSSNRKYRPILIIWWAELPTQVQSTLRRMNQSEQRLPSAGYGVDHSVKALVQCTDGSHSLAADPGCVCILAVWLYILPIHEGAA